MPAGSFEKLKWAFKFGADAVYAGVPIFSLRARENEFNFEDLNEAYKLARANNKKIYLTANIFAHNLKIKAFTEHLDKWATLSPDALIMSDPGLISIVKERHPEIPIHLSVQANCMNWRAVQFWKNLGVSRIILSRELRLTEIREIREKVPDVELEAFVHGSICIAYSGRCLLSHYMSYRDANQGVCDNSCRYPFRLYKNSETISDEFFLQDLRDPKEMYPIDEDEHGTYIMNSKDLCLIEHLKEISDAGICSFKVEGRTKSEYYVAMISRLYRQAIDRMLDDRPFDSLLLNELQKLSNRGYHKGFMLGKPTFEAQNYEASPRAPQSLFAGVVREASAHPELVSFEIKNKVQVGDQVELISPEGSQDSTINKIIHNNKTTSVVHPGMGTAMIEFSIKPKDFSLILKKIK